MTSVPQPPLSRRGFLAGLLASGGALVLPGAASARAGGAVPARPSGRVGASVFALDVPERALAGAAGGWRTTRELAAPARFDLLGLRWAGSREVSAEVRVRQTGGRWGRWVRMPHSGDHAPDGRTPPPGAEPVWFGSADRLQVRLSGRVRNLRAHFVRTHGPQVRSSRARSAAETVTIIGRSTWDPDNSCPPRVPPSYGEVDLAFVHHTVSANDYAPEDSAGIVLAMCHYHRDVNKWNDLGYNFVVDKYGQIFEGRAGGVDQAVIGAQTQGYNRLSTGIANIGTYSDVPLPDPGVNALAHLIAWKLALHGVPTNGEVTVTSGGGDVNRYPSGTPVTFNRISGHRDGDSTECPGNALYAQLPQIRAIAAGASPATATLTLAADRPALQGRSTTRLSGQLTLSDGTPAAGAGIEVQAKSGKGWKTIATAATAANGGWAAPITSSSNRVLRARAPASGPRPTLVSRTLNLTVAPVVRARASRKRMASTSITVVSGSVSPHKQRVLVSIARKGPDGRYRVVHRVPGRARRGRFAVPVAIKRPGLYRLVVRSVADKRNVEGLSSSLFVRVLTRAAASGGSSAPS